MNVPARDPWVIVDDPIPAGRPDPQAHHALCAWWSTHPQAQRPLVWSTDWTTDDWAARVLAGGSR